MYRLTIRRLKTENISSVEFEKLANFLSGIGARFVNKLDLGSPDIKGNEKISTVLSITYTIKPNFYSLILDLKEEEPQHKFAELFESAKQISNLVYISATKESLERKIWQHISEIKAWHLMILASLNVWTIYPGEKERYRNLVRTPESFFTDMPVEILNYYKNGQIEVKIVEDLDSDFDSILKTHKNFYNYLASKRIELGLGDVQYKIGWKEEKRDLLTSLNLY